MTKGPTNMATSQSTTPNKDIENGSDVTVRRIHNKLLYTTIAIDFLHRTVNDGIPEQQFRARVRNYIGDPASNGAKDVEAFLNILESKGLIGIGDYDILKDIVQFDAKLIKEIVDTELALQSHGVQIYMRVQNGNVKKIKKYSVDRGEEVLSLLKFSILKNERPLYILINIKMCHSQRGVRGYMSL